MARSIALLMVAVMTVACAGTASRRGDHIARESPGPLATGTPLPVPTETPVPDETRPVRFAVIGDFGSGFEEQYRLAGRMCRWHRSHGFNLVITTGDNIYDSGHPEDFGPKFFRPYDCLFDAGVRWRAVLGNHDVVTDDGRPELREPAFGMKARNYVLRKRGVRFVMWDSTTSDREWLRAHVGEETGDRWTVVSFHHPVFTPGPHGNTPGYRPGLPRLFARKGVDLVVNGHDHLYALMPAKRKVRYVVTGGGGAGLYPCEDPEIAAVCIERHHFLYTVVGDERIRVRAVPISGRPFHRFTTRGSR